MKAITWFSWMTFFFIDMYVGCAFGGFCGGWLSIEFLLLWLRVKNVSYYPSYIIYREGELRRNYSGKQILPRTYSWQ